MNIKDMELIIFSKRFIYIFVYLIKLIFWFFIILSHKSQTMAPSKNTKTAPRARIAHKLARYVRANPINLQSRLSAQNPSVTHLSKS